MIELIEVPETILPSCQTIPAFKVGKYLCSKGEQGNLAVTADRAPWVNINFSDAKAACEAAGFKLITESQSLAIAWNISQQAINWTGGEVGSGDLYQGLRNGDFDEPQPPIVETEDATEQRWFELSNGERIYDFAGNAYTWVFDDVQGDENGLIAKPFSEDTPSLTAPYKSLEKGMGWRPEAGANWSGDALIRGGSWYSGCKAGAFRLYFVWPSYGWEVIGFRCTNPGL